MKTTMRKMLITLAFAIAATTAARAQQQADFANATPVTVTISSYAFAPDGLTFNRGVAYRLHLVNSSGKAHNFSASKLFAASQIAPQDANKVEDGKIEVAANESVDVVFTPMTPGEYEIRCTHFMHSMMGMHAKAVVQ